MQQEVTINFGHPWTQKSGWDLLELKSDNEQQLIYAIKEKESEYWKLWTADKLKAVMYKPSNANKDWTD